MANVKQRRTGRVDWDEARDFWLALDPPRPFGTVAERFTVSVQRVRFIAKRESWAELAADVDARTLEQAKQRIVRSRAERVRKTLGIVDGLLDRYDQQLDVLELKPADLDRLVKLAELLEGEATDRITVGEAQQGFAVLLTIAARYVPKQRRQAFLAEVRDSIGDLGEAAT
jgi:hypothetical protein